MLQDTKLVLYGCKVWLETDDKRTAKSTATKLVKFFEGLDKFVEEAGKREGIMDDMFEGN